MTQDWDEEKTKQSQMYVWLSQHILLSQQQDTMPEQNPAFQEYLRRIDTLSEGNYSNTPTFDVEPAFDIEGVDIKYVGKNRRVYLSMKVHAEEFEGKTEPPDQTSDSKEDIHEYKQSKPPDTWVSYWIASPIGYLLPKDRREEWLGDLYEVNQEMLELGKPLWLINLVNLGRTAILIVSALEIKVTDFFSFGQQKSE